MNRFSLGRDSPASTFESEREVFKTKREREGAEETRGGVLICLFNMDRVR
jgi:hypothetical protein